MRAEPPSICRRGSVARRILCLSLPALTLCGSCAAPVVVLSAGLAMAQVGTTAYVNGELQTSLFVDFAVAVESARAAGSSLGLKPTSLRYEGRTAIISASDLGNRSTTVQVTRVTARVCKITIRVGFWGDQSMSRLMLVQMQRELAALGYTLPGGPFVPEENGSTVGDQSAVPAD